MGNGYLAIHNNELFQDEGIMTSWQAFLVITLPFKSQQASIDLIYDLYRYSKQNSSLSSTIWRWNLTDKFVLYKQMCKGVDNH